MRPTVSNNDVFTIAYKYHELGRCIIPSGGGRDGKSALVQWKRYQTEQPTNAQIEEWQSKLNPSIWAMPTGPVSQLFGVDCDTPKANATMEAAGLKPHVKTAKGFHYYVCWPSWTVSNSSGLIPGIDVRGQGGYVNFCGGNGKASYEVLIIPTDDSLYTVERLPAELQKVLRPKPKTLADRMLQEALNRAEPGKRNDIGLWLACQLRDNGLSQRKAEGIMRRYATEVSNSGPEPYTEREAIATLEQSFTRPGREAWDTARLTSEYQTQTNKRTKYIFFDEHNNPKLDLEQLVTDLLAEFHFATLRDTDEVLIYQEGYYQQNGVRFIKQECQRRVGVNALLTEHKVKEIIGHITRSTYVDRRMFNADKYIINLTNGLLDVCTRELKPHTPRFLSTIRIPVSYNPNADCPVIKKFFTGVHHPEDILIISELFGYCLIPDYTLQWAFLFIGDGSNGKSVELNLLKAFIGGANCSNIPWHALEQHRFASSVLEGKLANIFADLPSQSLNMTTRFKMLTGGDTLDAEKKFKDPFSFVNFARLVFSANRPPKLYGDDSFAFWRRWIILEFPNQFNDDQKDPDILTKLTTPGELSGLLNLALNGLHRLLTNKIFSYHRSVNETTEYYLRAADPVYAFLQDCCEPSSEDWVSKDKLYEIFGFYCKAMSIPLAKPNAFARSLQNQTAIHVISTRPQAEGKRITAWQGIKLSDAVKDVNDVNDFPLFKSYTRNPHINKSKRKNTDILDDPDGNEDIPDYPTQPCHNCGGGDYWLTDWNEWLCSRCHPKPESKDNAE